MTKAAFSDSSKESSEFSLWKQCSPWVTRTFEWVQHSPPFLVEVEDDALPGLLKPEQQLDWNADAPFESLVETLLDAHLKNIDVSHLLLPLLIHLGTALHTILVEAARQRAAVAIHVVSIDGRFALLLGPGITLASSENGVSLHITPQAPDILSEYNERLALLNADRDIPESKKPEAGKALIAELAAKYRSRLEQTHSLSAADVGIRNPTDIQGLPPDFASVVERCLARQLLPPAADWHYYGRLARNGSNDELQVLVSYKKMNRRPRISDAAASLRCLLPKAFQDPLDRPFRPPASQASPGEMRATLALGVESGELSSAFNSLLVDDDEADLFKGAKERAETAVAKHGSEALGWYQPFHDFDPTCWGICLDGRNLLDLAMAMWTELNGRVRNPNFSLPFVVQLVLQHELFHARCEAIVSGLELQTRRPAYRRYSKSVYQRSTLKTGSIEEALANYSAFYAAGATARQWISQGLIDEDWFAAAEKFVRRLFSISPAGYRDWERGQMPETWRTLAGQLSHGRESAPSGVWAPLEGLFSEHGSGDVFLTSSEEVPLFIDADCRLARILFAVPSVREAERMLRANGFEFIQGRGKGSHAYWAASDGGAPFTLPSRDPLSIGVFHELLRRCRMSKSDYMKFRQAG